MVHLKSIVLIGLVWIAAAVPGVRAQNFEAPQNARTFEDKGKFDAFQQNLIKFRDSKNEAWLLSINHQTQIVVEGEAEADYLRPGLAVQFIGKLDKKGALVEPIEEIEIFTPQGKAAFGFFPAKEEEDLKPMRNPGAGTYRIKGKLASFRSGEMLVVVGIRKLNAKTAEDLVVTLKADDLNLAESGDEMTVKAWYDEMGRPNPFANRPGLALAEQITVKLSNPVVSTAKKIRPLERPAKAAVRSNKGTK